MTPTRANAGLSAAYTAVTEFAAALDPLALLAFSRCHGWVVADVLFHLLCDAQRALVAFATPDPGPPDRDYASYWTGFAAESTDGVTSALSVRRSAAAFQDGTGIVALWRETAPAVLRVAQRADPQGCVATQGHVLSVPDFICTLATEAAVHYLDMTIHIGPPAQARVLVTATLDRLLDAPRPQGFSDDEYLRKGTGREPLSENDVLLLGPQTAAKFPLLS